MHLIFLASRPSDLGRSDSDVDRVRLVVFIAVQRDSVIGFVVEEASECKFKETVMEWLGAINHFAKRVVVACTVARLVRVHGVKVGRVRGMNDSRLKWRLLTSQFLRPIDLLQEGMQLYLVHIFTETLFLATAQSQNYVRRVGCELRLGRNFQRLSPMNYLKEFKNEMFKF